MTRLNHITLLAAFLSTSLISSADDLTKEITIEKDIVPQEREASRLNQLPSLSLPAISMKKLNWSDRAVSAPITNAITVLSPAAYASSIERTPYRGYVSLGYFPSFQLGLSAGYHFIDDEATQLGAWLQFDGSNYKRENLLGNKLSYRNNGGKLGVNFDHTFDGIGKFTSSLGYSYTSYNFPTLFDKGLSQTVNNIGLDLGWSSSLGKFDYNIGLGYDYFAFGKTAVNDPNIKALNENSVNLGINGLYNFSEKHGIGADINVNLSRAGNQLEFDDYLDDGTAVYSETNETVGFVRFVPHYEHRGDKHLFKLGVGVDYIREYENKAQFDGYIYYNWKPSSSFSAVINLYSGDPQSNSLKQRFAMDNYISPVYGYYPSYTKFGIDAGFLIGPFSGASFEVWAGAASDENIYMPLAINSDEYSFLYGLQGGWDYTSAHYGIAFNYNYNNVAKFRLSYEGAPNDLDAGYKYWLDRAKNEIIASVTVTPVSQFDISLSYKLRTGRTCNVLTINDDLPSIIGDFSFGDIDLGKVKSLDLGASYRFTPKFSVWASVENLLNAKWQQNYYVPGKGTTGLVGVSYKF
jgi:hypothetical protein